MTCWPPGWWARWGLAGSSPGQQFWPYETAEQLGRNPERSPHHWGIVGGTLEKGTKENEASQIQVRRWRDISHSPLLWGLCCSTRLLWSFGSGGFSLACTHTHTHLIIYIIVYHKCDNHLICTPVTLTLRCQEVTSFGSLDWFGRIFTGNLWRRKRTVICGFPCKINKGLGYTLHFDRAALLNPHGNIPIIVANLFTPESHDGLCGNLVRHKGRRER